MCTLQKGEFGINSKQTLIRCAVIFFFKAAEPGLWLHTGLGSILAPPFTSCVTWVSYLLSLSFLIWESGNNDTFLTQLW